MFTVEGLRTYWPSGLLCVWQNQYMLRRRELSSICDMSKFSIYSLCFQSFLLFPVHSLFVSVDEPQTRASVLGCGRNRRVEERTQALLNVSSHWENVAGISCDAMLFGDSWTFQLDIFFIDWVHRTQVLGEEGGEGRKEGFGKLYQGFHEIFFSCFAFFILSLSLPLSLGIEHKQTNQVNQ